MADGVNIKFQVVSNNLHRIAEGLKGAAGIGLDKALADIEQQAKSEAPVVTGGLRASGFRITPVYDDFDQAASAMSSANPNAVATASPSLADLGEGTVGAVGFAADYAAAVHNGHHTAAGNWVPGNPFLSRAAIAGRPKVLEALKAAVEALERAG